MREEICLSLYNLSIDQLIAATVILIDQKLLERPTCLFLH